MASPLTLIDLRCEYRQDPLSIETLQPRLSWLLAGEGRGLRQEAYRVQVASSPERLREGQADLWDSGRVVSRATAQVVYAGRALHAREQAWWRAMAWDGDQQPSPWSATARWEQAIGPNWQARWIGLSPAHPDERLPLIGCRWIRQAASAPAGGMLLVRLRFTLPETPLLDAQLHFVADGYDDSWNQHRPYLACNGQPTGFTTLGRMRAPTRWSIAPHLRAGENEIVLRTPRLDSGVVLGQLLLSFADGRQERLITDERWQALVVPDVPRAPGTPCPQGPEGWARPDQPWGPVITVGEFGAGPFPEEHPFRRMDRLVPPIVFRRDLTIAKPLARARLSATACGIYELALNGTKIGDEELAPGWTDYRARILYQCHDVTAALRPGRNALWAVVADGWFCGHTFLGANTYGTRKALLLELHLLFADGSEECVYSGPDWMASTSAIRSADLHMGQEVDLRRSLVHERDGEIDPAQWRPAEVLPPPTGRLTPQVEEPVRVTAVLPPRAVREHEPGRFLVDFGQNLAGRVRLRLRAPAGTCITLRHGEMLAKDGSLYTENLRSARATDTVICDGQERWFEPRLTFHGFRFAEITGLPGPLLPEDVVAVVIHSDCAWSGGFSCSDPRLEQLQSNIRWSQRGNFISIPTDCPQRDERAGWTGDAQIFIRTATFNMDCASFFTKYQGDMVDAQHPNGSFPDYAPVATPNDSGHFGWGDAGVMVPWTIWQVYGDTRIISEHLPAMLRWIEYRTVRAKDGLNHDWSFGDWVSPLPQTPNEVLSPIYHAWAARLVAEMAEAVGSRAEAARCRGIVSQVQTAWLAAHVAQDGRISSDTQAAYALALRSGIVPPSLRSAMGRHLVAAVERAGWHLHTGFLGTGHLLPALSEIGREDVAFRLLMSDSYPSWLYPLTHGATTMWERWDGYHAELGPQNIGGMNSYNHYAFGAVGEWMYATIAGIAMTAPGGTAWTIRPRSGGFLRHARGEYRSILGLVRCAWRIHGTRWECDVTIPHGARAEVHIPTRFPSTLVEGGKGIAAVPLVREVRQEDQEVVVGIEGGSYRFAAEI